MERISVQPKQTPADGLPPASGLTGLLLDSSRGTLTAQEGGAKPFSGPPTGYKTRDRRKHSDCRHTWRRGSKRERERRRRHERVEQLLAQSSFCFWD